MCETFYATAYEVPINVRSCEQVTFDYLPGMKNGDGFSVGTATKTLVSPV